MGSIDVIDAQSGAYRVQDPPDNLRLRVCLWRVGPSVIISEASNINLQGRKELVEKSIKWQEKIFSSDEVERLSSLSNCETQVEKEYHEQIISLNFEDLGHTRIYTYVNHDREINELSEVLLAKESGSIEDSVCRRRHCREDSFVRLEGGDEEKDFKEMRVMAELHPTESCGVSICLCKLKWYTGGVFRVSPDFSILGMSPYRVEAGGAVYHFRIEHVSLHPTLPQALNQHLLQQKLYSRHKELLCSVVGNEFETISAGMTRLYITGDILSAQGFEYEPLYLHYFLDLPKGWTSSSETVCSGVTHRCSSSKIEGKKTFHFSLPIEFDLSYYESSEPPSYPRLILMLMSLDWWGRIRTEGYGYVSLPSGKSGEVIKVGTWRPVTGFPREKLRRFFVGGACDLSDPCFAAVPDSSERCLSRYGLKTISCGNVYLRLYYLRQRKSSCLESGEQPGMQEGFIDSPQQASIKAVLQAFFEARQRMVEARELIHSSLFK